MIHLLHLDDDLLFLHRCLLAFRQSPVVAHIAYTSSHTHEDFFTQFEQLNPACVLLDLSFGGAPLRGLDVLRELRSRGYKGFVMVMSALSSSEIILNCMRAGANDFLSKGVDESELTFRIARLLQANSSVNSTTQNSAAFFPAHVSGRSMREVQQRLARLLVSSVRSLLVSGESGTGKEMVAELLRRMLPPGSPFVSINCGALAASVLEAEIFGYEKGSFTGASQSKIGLYEAADGGWLFLDEVARLSLSAQSALLRAIENGEVRAIGSTRTKKVQVRVIAATNEPLDQMVEKGEFRADLLSRLRGYEITLPPLRARSFLERQEIIETLIARLNESLSLETKEFRISHSCMAVLTDLAWEQGNIRELWQTLQAMSVDAVDGVLTLEHLPTRYLEKPLQKANVQTQTTLQQNVLQLDSLHPNLTHEHSASAQPNPSTAWPTPLQQVAFPTFPLQFESLVDAVFEHVINVLKKSTGDTNPSQRTVAQMFNISRHEAAQRLANLNPAHKT